MISSDVATPARTGELDPRIGEVRGFNRFYTTQIGLLRKGYLKGSFSLTEVRVLYELGHREKPTATEIGKALDVDGGYLSRILAKFQRRGLIRRRESRTDGRHQLLRLTRKGGDVLADFHDRANAQVRRMLGALSPGDQRRLVMAMNTIKEILGSAGPRRAPFEIRALRIGDLGWIVHRHAVLYAHEHGWNGHFEGVVAGMAADFIKRFDPEREHCWVAERNGEVAGSVLLARKNDEVAQLSLLLVEPYARGRGIGRRLVAESTRFARRAGYKKITLWTSQHQGAARRLYEAAGYRLVHEERQHSFGQDLVGQTWELQL
ncbi:MAG: MarR family transcriptional regulator [Planctomycetes bacterium]|nr:MarR family transcriptional regulator [Planctomycetota bacterium]